MTHGTGMIPAGGILYRYCVRLMGYSFFFHSSFIFKLEGYNDLLYLFFFLFLGRIYCEFLSSRSCVSTWHAPLSVVTSGSRKKDSSPALWPSARSMLRWVCFSLQCASDMEIVIMFMWVLHWWLIPQVHYNVGKNLADRGNTTAAIGYYREAVR